MIVIESAHIYHSNDDMNRLLYNLSRDNHNNQNQTDNYRNHDIRGHTITKLSRTDLKICTVYSCAVTHNSLLR